MRRTIRDEAHGSIRDLIVGEVYSNDDIFRALKVSNAGGIRLSLLDNSVRRAVIMTSVQDFHVTSENPYHDRLEGGILIYTAGGKKGQQTLAGINSRLIGQRHLGFPIHGFVQSPVEGINPSARDVGNTWVYFSTCGTIPTRNSTPSEKFGRYGFSSLRSIRSLK